jgi:hypothetical protein
MLQIMRGQIYRSRIPRLVSGFRIPHKTGDFLPYIANDVGVLESPGTNVVVSVFTANHFGSGDTLEEAIGRIAAEIASYFTYGGNVPGRNSAPPPENAPSARKDGAGLAAALNGSGGFFPMIWFFERKGTHLRCEVRSIVEGDRYELVITDADGNERVESFTNSNDLAKRTLELETQWVRDGWNGPHMRFL